MTARPANVDALFRQGHALRAAGKLREAAAEFRRAVALAPGNAQAHDQLAVCLAMLGDLPGALAHHQEAVAHRATPEIHHNHGLTLGRIGRLGEAIKAFERAVALRPEYPAAWSNLGAALEETGQPGAAVTAYQRALSYDAGSAVTHFRLGNALVALGRHAEAAAAYRRAIAVDPGPAVFHGHLGVALAGAGDRDGAATAYRAALTRDPGNADAWHNLGQLERDSGRWAEAEAAYGRALAADPRRDTSRFARAHIYLAMRRFAEGWRDYRGRAVPRDLADGLYREPLPADLGGRRVLVRGDQGLGDEIFFLRFLPALRARGAWVAYEPDPRLAAMLARAAIADHIGGVREADYRVLGGDLPHALGATDTPPSIALTALPGRIEQVRAALGPPPWLGVTWRAGTAQKSGALFKQIDRDALARAVSGWRGTLVAVQRAPAAGEIEAFGHAAGRPVADLTALNDDLEAMLALVGLLDEYVCVSNTNVHLRAAAGRAARVLVPYPPEFRWLADGGESPWFPGTAAYRQAANGDWGAALARLAAEVG